jgi:uncharacterized protein (UPF0332 family)
MADDLYDNVLQNAVKLWFAPEIERRISAGELQKGVRIWAAQVLMEVDQPLRVNINSEVRGVFSIRTAEGQKGLTPGQLLDPTELQGINEVTLTADEPNCGHLTVMFQRAGYFLSFDFRYNAARIEQLMIRAQEFLSAASGSLRAKQYSAVVENLFAAVELLAKATLMIHPDERVLASTNHRFVHSEINRYRKQGNIPEQFAAVLNELASLRAPARYGNTPFALEHGAARKMSRTARQFYKHVDHIRPRRYKGRIGPAA